jgi:phage/plasmid-like protein (TIGR03299 family)
MADNINFVDGVASVAYAGTVPWHGYGTQLSGLVTAREMLDASHLEYEVEKRQLFAHNVAGMPALSVSDHFATVRTDTDQVLGVVGRRYEVLQNADAFEGFDQIFGEGLAIYETAGALGLGEKVWALAQIPGFIVLPKGDQVKKYLLFVNTHDGSMGARVKLVAERVVCQNTLNIALRERSGFDLSIRHTASAQKKLEDARNLFQGANVIFNDVNEVFQEMAKITMLTENLNAYFNKVFPATLNVESGVYMPPPAREICQELHETGIGSDMARGTLWGAYNAVVEYVDHHKKYGDDPERRFASTMFGGGAQRKLHAFNTALELLDI